MVQNVLVIIFVEDILVIKKTSLKLINYNIRNILCDIGW